MAVLGPQRAPFRSFGIAVAILYRIESLLDVFVYPGIVLHPSVPHTHVHHEQRLGPQILGELQHFMESETVRHPISPILVHVSRTFLYRTNGILPLETVGFSVSIKSFHVAAAGETYERRFHGFQLFRQVDAATVVAAFVSRRKKTYHIQHDRAGHGAFQREPTLAGLSRSRDFRRQLRPLRADIHRELAATQTLTAFSLQLGCKDTLVSRTSFYPERQLVSLPVHHMNAPETLVAHTVARAFEFQFERMLLRLVQHPVGNHGHTGVPHGPPFVRVRRIVLERTVVNQLGVKPAVAGMVDFLKENTIMATADGSSPLSGIDIQCNLCHGRGHTHSAKCHGNKPLEKSSVLHFMKNIEVNVFNLQDVDIFAQK